MNEKFVLKDMVKGTVTFDYYREGNLYYKTENGVLFPVPLDDVGTATFNHKEKGILLMRWMRKFLETVKLDMVDGRPVA